MGRHNAEQLKTAQWAIERVGKTRLQVTACEF
jgi:hypothetical protein